MIRGGEDLESLRVFVVGDLETFRAKLLTEIPGVEIDSLMGNLEIRSHVREHSPLPDGKYITTKRREEDKLALASIRDSLTIADALLRSREVIRDRPYLQTEIAMVIGRWKN